MPTTNLLSAPIDASVWERAFYAFLAEKEKRSGSRRTVESYSRMLQHFFGRIGKTPDQVSSPDALERPKLQQSVARGYTALDVQKLLAVIPDTVAGRRDRAIVLTLVLTKRRRSEVIKLKAKDITIADDRAFYSYRGKGGKTGRRELPRPAFDAIVRSLADVEKQIEIMAPDESLGRPARASAE